MWYKFTSWGTSLSQVLSLWGKSQSKKSGRCEAGRVSGHRVGIWVMSLCYWGANSSQTWGLSWVLSLWGVSRSQISGYLKWIMSRASQVSETESESSLESLRSELSLEFLRCESESSFEFLGHKLECQIPEVRVRVSTWDSKVWIIVDSEVSEVLRLWSLSVNQCLASSPWSTSQSWELRCDWVQSLLSECEPESLYVSESSQVFWGACRSQIQAQQTSNNLLK